MFGREAKHQDRQIVIRVLESRDCDAAHALLCAFKEESQRRSPVYDELRPDYRDVLARYVDEYVSRPDRTIFVAKEHEVLVGVIMGTIWNYLPIYKIPRMGYIPELYVVPEFRRRGIGKSLVHEMERWFRTQGAEFARIETMAAYGQNRSLYEGLGYQVFLIDLRRRLE